MKMKSTISSTLAMLALPFVSQMAFAQTTFYWNATNGISANTNWSSSANWLPNSGTPGSLDTAFFTITNSVPAITGASNIVNNVVTSSTAVANLLYTNSYVAGANPVKITNWNVTLIPAGVTLTANNMMVGHPIRVLDTNMTSVAIMGAGTLAVNGNVQAGDNGSTKAISGQWLDLSHLSNFVVNATSGIFMLGGIQRCAENMNFAGASNNVTVASMSLNSGPNTQSALVGVVNLGLGTNIFNVDIVTNSGGRDTSTLQFSGPSGGLRMRGVAGTEGSRVSTYIVNNQNNCGTTFFTAGTNFFNGHPLDIKIGTLFVEKNDNSAGSTNANGYGVVSFDTGTIDATTINVAGSAGGTGIINLAGAANEGAATGLINIGANGTLIAGSGGLALTFNNGVTSFATGVVSIVSGKLICSNSITKSSSASSGVINNLAGIINMVGGNIGSAAVPLDSLTLSNSTLGLAISNGNTNVFVNSLTESGTTDSIKILSLPLYTSYPVTNTLITWGSISPSPLFTLGAMPYSPYATSAITNYSGYLVVNGSSLQLIVTNGPTSYIIAPNITGLPQPVTRYTGYPAIFSVTAAGYPLSYQWYFNTNTPISLATNASFNIASISAANVGYYSVTITNILGSVTSTPVLLTVIGATNYAAEQVAGGPVAYWRFNETNGNTAYDYAGGYNGTNINIYYGTNGPNTGSLPVSFPNFENSNLAYVFDGIGNGNATTNKSCVGLPGFNLNPGAFSIVAWVLVNQNSLSLSAYYNAAIMSGGNNTWRLHLSDGGDPIFPGEHLEFLDTGTGSSGAVNAGVYGQININDGNWHQVATVYDGANISLYVDGTLDVSANQTGNIAIDSSLVCIGAQNVNGGQAWPGQIDEVAVYNRGISAAEVADLYQVATNTATGFPYVLVQPKSKSVVVGNPATFSVVAGGGPAYTYQWYHSGTNLPGATASTLTIPSPGFEAAGNYYVSIANSVGSTNSQVASLTVVPFTITQQPVSQTVFAGSSATISVQILGNISTAPYSFQWYFDNSQIPGATSSNLVIASAYYTNSGTYAVVVTPGFGPSIASSNSILTVAAPIEFANLTNYLMLHLPFDGNYNDTSGNGNNASPGGSPTFASGILGQAVSLSSSNASGSYNFVSVPDAAGLQFGPTTSFSVSFWIKTPYWLHDLPIIGNALNSTFEQGWVFALNGTANGGQIELSLASTANSGTYLHTFAASPIISDGNWHNVVGVIDRAANQATVYVDGKSVGSYSIAGLDTLYYGYPITIGQDPSGSYAYTGNGAIDDVGIWSSALTATQAESVYYTEYNAHQSFDTHSPFFLTIKDQGNGALGLIWQTGTLMSSTNVSGPYVPVAGAAAPFYQVTPSPTNAGLFYRAVLP